MPPNNTIGLPGRFCNHVIRNLYASFVAEASDLAMTYSYATEIECLGLPLFKTGTHTHLQTLIIRDEDFCNHLDKKLEANIFVDWLSAQNHEFSLRLYNYFRSPTIMESVRNANIYKARYSNNNDVFVHVRLDDAAAWNPGYAYYDAALQRCGAKSGFISSDSPDHPFVTGLSTKYNLSIVKKDEVETIMLAATCKYIVLSHGTFSWLMGALAFDAQGYIPPKKHAIWCGNIFDMPGWEIICTPE